MRSEGWNLHRSCCPVVYGRLLFTEHSRDLHRNNKYFQAEIVQPDACCCK